MSGKQRLTATAIKGTSDRMKSVRQGDTAPEMTVRRHLHRAGLRFKLHVRALPGSPDIVLPRRHSVVFVHGCFWHGHDCDHGQVKSKTNVSFWCEKIAGNQARDQRKAETLRELGWLVETIWECETHMPERLDDLARTLLRR